jgi:hypothetical protein
MMTPGMLDSMKSEQRMHTAQQSSAAGQDFSQMGAWSSLKQSGEGWYM